MGELEHMKEALHIKDKNSTLNIGLKASKELKLNYKLIDSTNFCILTFKKIFTKLKFSPTLLKKIRSSVCLVFKIENKWILKLQNLFS